MGGVVSSVGDAVGSVVGGVADAVGSVVEGAANIVEGAVTNVIENPGAALGSLAGIALAPVTGGASLVLSGAIGGGIGAGIAGEDPLNGALMGASLGGGATALGFGTSAATTAGMTAAELAATDPYLASIAGASGVTPAMETASMLSAAASPGVAASTAVGNAATGLGYDALGTAATGAGTTVLPTALDTALTQGYNTLGTPTDVLPSAPSPATGYDPIQAMSGTPAPIGTPTLEQTANLPVPTPSTPSPSSPTITNTASQTATSGVPQLTAEQIATLQGNPEALAAYQAAGMLPTSTTSWLDYISTGLGVVNGVSNVLGGNSLDASQIQNMIDPFAPYRAQYAGQLNQLMANPASVTSLPGYQFLQDQGMQTVQRGLSAQGKTVSGQEQLALQEQGQGLANKYLGDQYTRLAQLSGANANPGAGGTAGAETMVGNQAQQQAGWTELAQLAGKARIPGTSASNVVSGIGNLVSGWR